ncbi:MAG: hypothetical protein J1E05_05685 [Eubacterium sp.]|nr:hypothetical protein [Eubacterium sp.]
MKIIIKFEDVDISSIVKTYQKDKQEELEGSSRFGSLKKQLFGAGMAFAEFAAKELLEKKPEVIERTAESMAKNYLEKHRLKLTLDKIILLTDDSSTDLSGVAAEISDVDYSQILTSVSPKLVKRLKKTYKNSALLKILNVITSDDETLKNIMSAIDDEKKEQLLQIFVTEYNDVICNEINGLAQKRNIAAKVNEIIIEA